MANVSGGLRSVDVSLGMHRFISSARAPEILAREIRDNFVHVHVDRNAAPAGEHVDRKLSKMFAANERVASLFDRALAPRVDHVRIAICACGGFFDGCERANVVRIVSELASRKSQVFDRPDGLDSVQCVDGNRARPQ